MGHSTIEWLNRPGTVPETWNPVVGCTPVSSGCDHCWAAGWASRLAGMGQEKYRGLTDERRFRGVVKCDESVLQRPMHWTKPRTVGVSLMGDIFHDAVPLPFLLRVLTVIAACPRHTFIVVTKRPKRAASLLGKRQDSAVPQEIEAASWPLPNLWVLVSCEDNKTYDQRVPYLEKIQAAVRGVSIEPMLGPVAVPAKAAAGVEWVIFGAESINGGAGRVCKNPWIASGVLASYANRPVFVKQIQVDGRISKDPDEWPPELRVREWPKPSEQKE